MCMRTQASSDVSTYEGVPTSALIWRVEFRSRRVAVLVFTVSKSTVMPNGIPISSVRAYLLPIDPLLSSTL